MKYSEEIVEKIVSLIEEDDRTISEVCILVNISRETYYQWLKDKKEFAQAIKDAEERRNEEFELIARQSLRQKLKGYEVVTERTTYKENCYGEDVRTGKVVTRKRCEPDIRAIKFVLERQDKKRAEEESKKKNTNDVPIIVQVPRNMDGQEVVGMMTEFVQMLNKPTKQEVKDENGENIEYDSYPIRRN